VRRGRTRFEPLLAGDIRHWWRWYLDDEVRWRDGLPMASIDQQGEHLGSYVIKARQSGRPHLHKEGAEPPWLSGVPHDLNARRRSGSSA
jgi:hypothetical protein